MEKHKTQIELNFEYAQTQEDVQSTKNWLNEQNAQIFKEKTFELIITLFGDIVNDLFLLSSLILLFLSITQSESPGKLNPLIIFLVYLLPFLIEIFLQIIHLLVDQKGNWKQLLQQTRIPYLKIKGFKKEDMYVPETQNFIRQGKSSSIRSVGHLESQSNVQQDILSTYNIEDVQYHSLKRGDFIILQKGQQCPGDLIILDMSDRHGYFYSKSYNRQAFLQKKEPMKTTKVEQASPNKGDLIYMRKILKGKITFNNDYTFDFFEGHIKLSKDPKGDPITTENILFFGQAIQFNEWIFGILINVGGQSLFCRRVFQTQQQKNTHNRYKAIKIIQFILYIILPIISSLIQYYGYDTDITFNQLVLNCFEQFLVIHPSYLRLFLLLFDILMVYLSNQSTSIELEAKELISTNTNKLNIKEFESKNYPCNVESIMDTTHVFLNIQILSEAKIEALCHGETIYQIDQSLIRDLVKGSTFKSTQFYYNLIKQVNEDNFDILQEKIESISTYVPPQKLSITTHTQSQVKVNENKIYESNIVIKRSILKQNTQTLLSPNNNDLQKQQFDIFHSMDGLNQIGQNNQIQNSQASQEPDDDQIKQIQIFRENTLVELGINQPYQYFELFTVISLCHLTRSELVGGGNTDEIRSQQKNASRQGGFSERERKRKIKFKIDQYFLAEDEALIKLSKLFKISYKTSGYNKQDQLCTVLKINNLQISYIIHYRLYHQGFIDYDENRTNKLFKIPSRFIAMMIQDDNFQIKEQINYLLLCRFCIVSINDIPGYEKFDLIKKATLQKQIQYLINRGDIIVCYLKMPINTQDLQQFYGLIVNDYEKTIQLIELLSERQYEIIGLFGISQNDNIDLIKESFINNRSRIIVQSEKPYELVLPFCIKNNVVHNETITYNFQSSSREDILYQIRQIISSLNQDEIKRSSTMLMRRGTLLQSDKIRINNNTLIIDANVLNIILSDTYLTNHFGFIIHFNKIIIVYNMNNSIKERFLGFIKQYDSEYYASFCLNYSTGSYGLIRMSNFSYQRHYEIDSDVMSFMNNYSIGHEDLELFDNVIIKKGFQMFQIKDAICRILIQWNLCFALLQISFYCFPYYQGQLVEVQRLLLLQIFIPFILCLYTSKTIFYQQEYLSVKINTIKQKALNLKNTFKYDLIFETLFDVIIIAIGRYVCIRNSLIYDVYNSKEEISAYFSFIIMIHMFKMAFLTKSLYLFLFFILTTILILLIHMTIEMISIDYEILKFFFSQVDTIMTMLLILSLKVLLNILFQFSIYLYNNFLDRSQNDIDFNLILETLTKESQQFLNVQNLIKKVFKDNDVDQSVKQILNKGDNKNQLIQLNSYTLNFEQEGYYLEFIVKYITKWKVIGVITNTSYFFGLDIFLLIHFAIQFNTLNLAIFIIMIFLTFSQLLLIRQQCYPNFKKLIIYFGFMQTIFRLFIICADVYEKNGKILAFMFYFLLICSLTQQINYKFTFIVIQQIITLIVGILMLYINQTQQVDSVYLGELIILLCSFSIQSLQSRYQDDVTQREDYVSSKELEIERQKFQSVMSLLLPPFVLGRVDQGNVNFSENQGLVGIIFVDMCSFDLIVKEEDQNIVQLMDNIYRQFDQICSSANCQKIETVGKTYMACSGLQCVDKFQTKNNQLKNPIERLIELAFGIQQEISNFKWGVQNKQFGLKIGVHYGRVLMGVIGSIKPQFSLIGDTVNTTSRLCAHCPEGTIQISQQAFEQIKNIKSIKFTPNKIEAKGKGIIDTMLIEKKRNFDASFNNKQKKQEQPKIDQKLKYVLNYQQQPSFRGSTQQQAIRQRTQKHLTYKQIPIKIEDLQISQQQQQLPNNLQTIQQQLTIPGMQQQQQQQQQQLPSQTVISSQILKNANMNNFATSQLQLFRKTTKRNLMNNTNQNNNMVSINQMTSPVNLNQIPSPLNPNQSNKLIHQKSLFSHIQNQLQQQSEKNHSNNNQNPQSLVQTDSIGQLLIQGMPEIPLDQSLCLAENSIREQTPFNQKKEESKKQVDQTIRMIKFNDVELFIKNKPEIFNKKMPLFKIQEFFVEPKNNTITENNVFIMSKDFIIEAFKNSQTVIAYYEQELQYGQKSVILSLLLMLIINSLFLILSQIQQIHQQQAIIRSVGCFLIICQLILLKTNYFEWTRKRLLNIIIIQLILECVIFGIFYEQDYEKSTILTIETIVISCLLFAHKWLYFQEKILICAFMFTTWLIIISSVFMITAWEIIFLLISYVLLLQRELLSYLFSYKQMRNQEQIELKQLDKMNLLSCLLPIHVLTKFLDDSTNSRQFSDVYSECTILFADIAGFTKYSSSVQPEEVVQMLKNLFDEFDKLTQVHNVFKLYTIGDCYVVIGVTDNFRRDPIQEAFNVVEMSLNMLESINIVRNQINYHDLHMRIGIHTGNVIGGIIGTDIIRYDVYGKDILIANKMESSSEEGRVLVSETTKKLIEDNFPQCYQFSGRKLVPIPSVSTTITGFFLETAI